MDLKVLHEGIESNPRLGEALLNVEQNEAERWKKMFDMTAKHYRKQRLRLWPQRVLLWAELLRLLPLLSMLAYPHQQPTLPNGEGDHSTSEADRLREELSEAEARAQHHDDETRECQG
jgi:hypothetical protein